MRPGDRLALEAGTQVLVLLGIAGGEVVADRLDRDVGAQLRVVRSDDGAQPALTERRLEAVAGGSGTGGRGSSALGSGTPGGGVCMLKPSVASH